MMNPASNTLPFMNVAGRARARDLTHIKGSSTPKSINVVQTHQLLFEQVAARARDPTHI